MALKVCAEPACPVLTESARCPAHTRQVDKARGTRQQRGYDADYDRQRAAVAAAMARGQVFHCWRCDGVVLPHELSIGHCDDDRSIIHGVEHLRQCNLANTRGGCPHRSHA